MNPLESVQHSQGFDESSRRTPGASALKVDPLLCIQNPQNRTFKRNAPSNVKNSTRARLGSTRRILAV